MKKQILTSLTFLLCSCFHKGPNPVDPYESLNRKTTDFNLSFDATFLRPPARLYHRVVPGPIKRAVNNVFMNFDMIPTIVNDVLQADWRYTIKDSWRLFINTTFGVAGLIDVASTFGLPPHSNDLGLTFAKWGVKKSAYLVVPLLGPSTFRDGFGMLIEYPLLTPYSYFTEVVVAYGLFGLRALDLRSQLIETEKLMHEALDPYVFIRDAWLQNRNYRITGVEATITADDEALYVEE